MLTSKSGEKDEKVTIADDIQDIGTTIVAAVVDSVNIVRHPVHRLKALFGLAYEPTVAEKIDKAIAASRRTSAAPTSKL